MVENDDPGLDLDWMVPIPAPNMTGDSDSKEVLGVILPSKPIAQYKDDAQPNYTPEYGR